MHWRLYEFRTSWRPTLSPNLVHQLTWDRFVSSHGGKGRNIPCDLHNEHVNKLFKDIIKKMGANFTEVASTRVARAVTTIEQVVELFDTQTGIHPQTSTHSRKCDDEDVKKVLKALVEQNILTVQSTPRSHTAFSNMTANSLQSLNRHKLEEWIAFRALQRGYIHWCSGPHLEIHSMHPRFYHVRCKMTPSMRAGIYNVYMLLGKEDDIATIEKATCECAAG